MTEFVSNYGVWMVAAFIALESIGLPLPAEAALIAAAFFAARTHGIDIWSFVTRSDSQGRRRANMRRVRTTMA